MAILSESLTLPSGKVLKNRFGKAAMSENMADAGHIPGERYKNLYQTWARGGAGLLITGNVMVDRNALGEPHNVVLDDQYSEFEKLRAWAEAGTIDGTQLVMQLNHPGKQSPKFLSREPVAPSAIPLKAPLHKMFNTPRELTEAEILNIVKRFAFSAGLAKEAGFSGVQIHGAHGYLVSQFLSTNHNRRKDQWGGTLENRMRFLVEVYKAIRERVGKEFIVGLKINSADFQRGGFSEEDSMHVIETVDEMGFDFVEISGGSYESTEMLGNVERKNPPIKESTKKREAYFLEYASQVKKRISVPLMVTGGFRTLKGMEDALSSGALDLIGLARPFAIDPNIANNLLNKTVLRSEVTAKATGIQFVDAVVPLEITWYTQQLHRMGRRKMPRPNYNVWFAVIGTLKELGGHLLKKAWRKLFCFL